MVKEKLRLIRKEKGYTQQQVADFLATDVSNYSRKESGDVKIIKEEWEKLSKFFKVPVEEIFENDSPFLFPTTHANNDLKPDKEATYLSVINNLQDYIALLKEENERLKKQKIPEGS